MSYHDLMHLLRRGNWSIPKPNDWPFEGKTRNEVIKTLFNGSTQGSSALTQHAGIAGGAINEESNLENISWFNDPGQSDHSNTIRKNLVKTWYAGMLFENQPGIGRSLLLFLNDFFFIEISKMTYPIRAYRHYRIIQAEASSGFKELIVELILNHTLSQYVKKIKPADVSLPDALTDLILKDYLLGPEYKKITSKEKIKKLRRLLNEWSMIRDSLLTNTKKNVRPQYVDFGIDAFGELPSVRDFIDKIHTYLDKMFKVLPVAEHVTRKIFKWMCREQIDASDEDALIRPLSEVFRTNGYRLIPVFESLLSNDRFYSDRYKATMAKTPFEFLAGLFRDFDIPVRSSEKESGKSLFYECLRNKAELLGEDVGDAKIERVSVDLIPHEQMRRRKEVIEQFLYSGFTFGSELLRIDCLHFAKQFPNPVDPEQLISDMRSFLIAEKKIAEDGDFATRQFSADLAGQSPDWATHWRDAIVQGPGSKADLLVRQKLTLWLHKLLLLPGYQAK